MQNFLLLLVAFLAGAILMALELVGSRVLAPHFGGSIFVWGSLIGVFLAALSIGYYLGGRLVDLIPNALLLAAFLFGAGLFVLLIPRYGAEVCDRILMRDFGPRANPLVACTLLFFVPGMLMAVTSPFVIRLTASTIKQVGRTAGMVYAISTTGSIAGTLGAAFYLIPAVGTRALLYLLGGLLILTAVVAAMVRKSRRAAAGAVALLALCAVSHPGYAEERILLERDSPYHRLIVAEEGHYRWLRADNIWHTQMDLNDRHGRGLPYCDYVDLAFLFNPDIRDVLVIGLGGGTIPKRFVRDYPNVHVDAVDIDADVVRIAERFFDVHAGPRLAIHQADGRLFLRRTNKQYDLIVLDAYYADTVPFFLTTREFFQIALQHLRPRGILVNNVVSALSGPGSHFFRSVYRTMGEVFPNVYAFQVPESGTRVMNLEVFGVKSEPRTSMDTLRQRAVRMQGTTIKDDRLTQRLGNYVGRTVRTNDVPTLTDDYAPVDALLHLW